MVRIAPHHDPRHPLSSDTDFTLSQNWGTDVYVQWGRKIDEGAFFEAFTDAGELIRSDEEDLQKAEETAFKKYLRVSACDHAWSRKFPDGFGNGVGVCRKCKQSNTKAFPPIIELGAWRKQIGYHDFSYIMNSGLRPGESKKERNRKYNRILAIKTRVMGVNLPPVPDEPQNDDEFIDRCPDSYRVGVREAIAHWLEHGKVDLDPTYQKLLRKNIFYGRDHDAKVWSRMHYRDKLRRPVETGPENASIERDDVGVYCTFKGIKYRPCLDWAHISVHDETHGGLHEGDHVSTAPLDRATLVISLPDGRKLHWSNTR